VRVSGFGARCTVRALRLGVYLPSSDEELLGHGVQDDALSSSSAKVSAGQIAHAPYACKAEGVNAIRKQNTFSVVMSTEGRVVGLCWAK
jgi:hypothetical protein